MTDPVLVGVPGLWAACTAREAIGAATGIARELAPGITAWSVGTDAGCDENGRSTRWEVHFDLPTRSEAVVAVGFTREESSGLYRDAVASVCLLPFPSEGSELARMALAGEISGRRLRAVWRQHARDRQPLPQDLPDSTTVAALVAPELIRTAHARISRLRGAVWAVRTRGGIRNLRAYDLR